MNFDRHAIILEVVDALHRTGGRAGKTRIQKALALLHEINAFNVPFDFVLYKHGPYSFDVEQELELMKSYSAIEINPAADGYGVTITPGISSDYVRSKVDINPADLAEIDKAVKFIAGCSAVELERLATAAWVRNREGLRRADDVARRIVALKPHVKMADALAGDEKLTKLTST